MRNIKSISAIACLLLCTLLFSACSDTSTPKVKHNDCALWHKELKGANPEYVEDYEYLWDLLENEYPMLPAAERITGKKAEDIKQQHYYYIPLAKTPQDFFDIVVNPCVSQFQETGHLCALHLYTYENLYFIYKCLTMRGCDAAKYNYQQLTASSAKKFYKNEIKEADSRMKENDESSISNTDDNLTFQYYPESATSYVKIKKMNTFYSSDNPEYNALRDFFQKLETEHYQNYIIDIRGNGGGNEDYWTKSIVQPNLSKSASMDFNMLINGEACKSYFVSRDDHYGKSIRPISELNTSKFPHVDQADIKNARYFIHCSNEMLAQKEGHPVFSGKFWMLTDKNVYSASEAFTAFCKQTGFATIVGTPTDGDGIGTDPIVFSLPNTGICLRFSASNGLNPDGTCNEEYGTAPDYSIAEGEDALQKCLSLISVK